MSAGMGEGWSDFYARALLSTADEDPNGIYTTGGWVTYQLAAGYTDNYYYGIRRFPYASISTLGANGRPHNPLTFADIDAAQINTTDGAYPRNPLIPDTALEVHNVGEVWASALLEVRARFITRLGWAVGNERILQFVTDGMKLDPINPTLLQGRDAILAAAAAGGGTAADRLDIWSGFAARGMGASAQVLNRDHWPGGAGLRHAGHLAGAGDARVGIASRTGGWIRTRLVTVSLCVDQRRRDDQRQRHRDVAGHGRRAGRHLARSRTGRLRRARRVCRTYTFTVAAACGATLTATLQTQESGGPARNLTYPLPGQPGALLQPELRRRDAAGAAERVDHEHPERGARTPG